MDAKQGIMAPILLALVLACLVVPAKCEGGGVERSAGGLRRRPDGEEMVVAAGSSKIHIVLCFKTACSGPSDNTCYCCQTLQGECFWEQQECWNYCPSRPQRHQLAVPATPAAAPSSVVGEPRYKSVA